MARPSDSVASPTGSEAAPAATLMSSVASWRASPRAFLCALVAFALLNGLDLYLTWELVREGRGPVYEANPLAGLLLRSQGWTSLLALKVGSVCLVGCVCAVVARRRPRMATAVLAFACLALGAVVLYSSALANNVRHGPESSDWEEIKGLEQHRLSLDERFQHIVVYQKFVGRLADDLASGRISLAEAATRVAYSQELRETETLKFVRLRFRGLPDDQCLAVVLMEAAVLRQPTGAASVELAARLKGEFQATYGTASPPFTERKVPEPFADTPVTGIE